MSAMVTKAARPPLAAGVKVTLIVQFAPAATELPQVLVCIKSPALVPVMARLEIVKAALPVLVRVTACAVLVVPTDWLPKERLAGARLTAGAVPVPVRLTVWGLPTALSAMVSEGARLPLADGVKVTLIVQLAPAATLDPQLLVCAKSPGLVPVSAMLEMLKAEFPVLFRVMV